MREWLSIVAPILANPPSLILSKPVHPILLPQHSSDPDDLRSASSMASITSSRTNSSTHSREITYPSSTSSFAGDEPWLTPSNPASRSVYVQTGLVPIAEDFSQSTPLQEMDRPDPELLDRGEGADLKGSHIPRAILPNGVRKIRSVGLLLDHPVAASQAKTPLASPSHNVDASDSLMVHLTHGPDTVTPAPLIPPSASRYASVGLGGQRAASVMGDYANTDDSSLSQSSVLAAPDMTAITSSKSGRWGFLRKMSMNKLRSEKGITPTASIPARPTMMPPPLNHTNSDPVPKMPVRPSMNSTRSAATLPSRRFVQADVSEFGQAAVRMPSTVSTMPLGGFASNTPLTGGGNYFPSAPGKRRSFLPVDGPPSISVPIPSTSPFMPTSASFEQREELLPTARSEHTIEDITVIASSSGAFVSSPSIESDQDMRYSAGLESIKSYLRDLFDLSRPVVEPYGGFEVVGGADKNQMSPPFQKDRPESPVTSKEDGLSIPEIRRTAAPGIQLSRNTSSASFAESKRSSMAESSETTASGKKFKNDRSKRARVIREIYE